MAKSTWTLVTGSVLLLVGSLTLAAPARAETEPPIAMAANLMPTEPVGLVQVAWPLPAEALADTFGQPAQARETPVVQAARLGPVTQPTRAPPPPAPAPAHPGQIKAHRPVLLERFPTR